MKSISKYIRQKLSVRVSLWVVLFAAMIFNAALGFLFYQSRKAVRQEAISHAMQILDNTSQRVTGILNRAEVATTMTEWLVLRHPDVADSMFVYSRGMLLNNPDLFNCSIAFEPDHFKEYGRFFSAYSKREGDSIRTSQGGSENYQYFYMDWYLMPTILDHPCWTEPYMDLDVQTNSKEMVTSYSKAIKDKKGQVIGVINTGLSLSWLSQTISSVKPYPNSYSIMIGRGGTYFVHPDSTKLTCQTIFTSTLEQPDTNITALGHAMQRGEKDMRHMSVDGKDCYVFYTPLGNTGWSMAIICPESDIFGGFDRLRRTVRIIVVSGLILMLFFFIRIITEELKPLGRLAKETKNIASGHFDAELPDLKRIDEIGQLSNSFGDMQQSLNNYIEELKKTTSQKAYIESELHVASTIQMGMLPKIFPAPPEREDIEIYASLTPAKEVGGDLFDFYIRDEKLFFCIGDVSGKGVPASLFMAVTRSIFRTVSAQESMPDGIVKALNNTINEMNETNMFVTLFVGVLDLPTGHLRYCNAGHDAPILAGINVDSLPVDSNLPIGVMSDWQYTLQDTQIFSDTTIFLYTDGLTEAEDISHAQFQMDRINEVMAKAHADQHQAPKQIIQRMTEAVHKFVGDAEQSDDLTMLAIRYMPQHFESLLSESLTIKNNIEEVPKVSSFMKMVSDKLDIDSSLAVQLQLAVEEAVVNVINYAYPKGNEGDIIVKATADRQSVRFQIIDNGIPFDPTIQKKADTTLSAEDRQIGGLGILLVRELMGAINYERTENQNLLTLVKKII